MIALLVAVVLFLVVPAEGGVLFFAGMEGGFQSPTNTVTEFAATDGSNAHFFVCAACVDTTPIHKGAGAIQFEGSNGVPGYVRTGFLNLTTMYTRFYLYVPVAGGVRADNSAVFMTINQANTARMHALMLKTDNKLYWCFNPADKACTAIATGATVLSAATWYLIEVKMTVAGSSTGGMELKINGTTEFTSFGTTTNGSGNLGFIAYGPSFILGNNTVRVFTMDDIIVRDDAYPGDGFAIGRTGTTGSPTYTAWTKNSCTSSLIESCWGAYPVGNSTPNASSATASDAQTMVMHDFATTQTGFGSDLINAHDTINACKTLMVAKSGTASAPLSIRRRINGSDTDTAKTLTTADLTYDDGIWTTSAANLRGAVVIEIGAVHGTGTATDTVQDMELTCDITAVTVPIRHRVTQ